MRTYTAGIGIPIGTSLSPNRAPSATATRWSHTAAVMSPPAKASRRLRGPSSRASPAACRAGCRHRWFGGTSAGRSGRSIRTTSWRRRRGTTDEAAAACDAAVRGRGAGGDAALRAARRPARARPGLDQRGDHLEPRADDLRRAGHGGFHVQAAPADGGELRRQSRRAALELHVAARPDVPRRHAGAGARRGGLAAALGGSG